MGDALGGEDRLLDRNVFRPQQAWADRLDAGEIGGEDHLRAGRHLDCENAAARQRAAHKPNDSCAVGDIRGVTAIVAEQDRVLVARQAPPDPTHQPYAWVSARSTMARTRSRR